MHNKAFESDHVNEVVHGVIYIYKTATDLLFICSQTPVIYQQFFWHLCD